MNSYAGELPLTATATPAQLAWRRFKRHRLAYASGVFLLFLYTVAVLCEFISPYATDTRNVLAINAPPMSVHFVDMNGDFHIRPFVYGYDMTVNDDTWMREYTENPEKRYPIFFFARGSTYEFWNLFESDRHLFTTEDHGYLHLFGTDKLGRDLFTRIMYGARISLSIGLIGVIITLTLGLLLGGLAGYLGGLTDRMVQRLIEVLQSIPTLPLWMALSAALPVAWSSLRVYFGVTIILSLFGWPTLARQVRGRFLALREEEFVIAARLLGAGRLRVIFRHMLPSFASHTITTATLAVPGMILGETALSFLGIGLRPPVVSWGVLMQQAQNYQVIVMTPWLLLPGLFVVLTVLSFNLLGDGLRDAADPYNTAGL
ncbi:MAG: ABC transporter permease [bacterium]|nr:ABC transporter permease [Gammaproteobacteria bacterium]HIL94491.1 ABC transporter permease [Pseudomonadales bacterium]